MYKKSPLGSIGAYSASNPNITIALVLAITLLGVVLATTIQMQMGMSLYIDHDSTVWKEWESLKDDFGRGNNVFVMVRSDDFKNPEVLMMIDQLDAQYSKIPDIVEVMSITDIIKQVNGGRLPETNLESEMVFKLIPPEQLNLYQPNAGTNIILARYGIADDEKQMVKQFKSETEFVNQPSGVDITITGQPIFELAAFGLMLPEMIVMFGGAFLMIILVLYLFMHKIRGRFFEFLPLASVLLGMMWMMGAMGVFGYNFNAIMLGVMPISMGLGIEYAIQIQTRYEEERALGNGEVDAARIAVSTSGKGLLFAMLTTVIGLGSLLVSEVPPVRQFGAVASISVISNMLICITFIPAFLARFDPGFEKCDIAISGAAQAECPPRLGIEEGFYQFTKLMTAKPYVTLFFVAILVAGGAYGFVNVKPETEMMNFWPSNLQEYHDIEQLKSEVESPKVITMTAYTEGLYEPEQFEKLHHMQMLLAADPKINTVDSITEMVLFMNNGKLPATKDELESIFNQMPPEVKARYFSESGDKIAIDYYIDDISGKTTSDVISKIESSEKYVDLGPDSAITITGSPILNRNVILNVTSGLTTMTATSFVLGFLFLLFAYRNFRTPLVLMLTIVTALFWVGGAMYLLKIPWNPLTVTMASITLGVGVDYGIHMHGRCEEECALGHTPDEAMRISTSTLGRAVLASAVTASAGFGVLALSRFPVLYDFGKTIMLSMGMSVAATFIVLPPLMVILEKKRIGKSELIDMNKSKDPETRVRS